ncbi:ATP-binding protein [Pelomonas sp. SE-A7]|uniref:sensor histidine kinase n=1 Tax=Pelomonas sp. SE-A7 TaxID=3054953 RepID=UPI00259CDBEB|nr:ATP-binding protein [Pelomonas sp. SE-A7]MDM4766543.1 ATP-binding protein [Pelomonas sp. SE-A7]
MGSEAWRLLAAALCWSAAGATVAWAGGSSRGWVSGAVLALVGLASAWPLRARREPVLLPSAEPEPRRSPDLELLLQTRLEHLPVAAWVLEGERLQPLSSRARRLAAPGGVRDARALQTLLREATSSGPVLLDTERGAERWLLRRQPLSIAGRAEMLLALVPLEHELETESLQAWQQLVQVLTHEIMNSLTPIQSLSQTARQLLDEPDAADELRLALDAIAHRAESLAGFVATYRQVSRWPAPQLAPVDLGLLFARLQQAIAPAWAARGGEARFEVGQTQGLRLMADEGQLEQALLALLSNAEQATAGLRQPRVWLQAHQGRGGRLMLSVRDNGPGVPAGLERQIFLPFFSAREGGQGIGLTVVRQLVNGMGGRVRHVRPVEGGAGFVLVF